MSDDKFTEEDTAAAASAPQVTDQDAGRADRAAGVTAAAQALFSGLAPAGDDEAERAGDGDDLGGVPVVAIALPGDEDDDSDTDADDDEDSDDSDDEDSDDSDDDDDSDVEDESDTDDDSDDDDDEDDEDESGAAAPVTASFGLIFQAPDLSDLPRRRSRRATSAVSTPAEHQVEDDEAEDQTNGDGDGEQRESGDGEQTSGRTRSRRRRGGKGRRSRTGGAADDNGSDDSDSDSDTDGAAQGSADGGEDAAETTSGGGSTGSRRSRSRRGRGTGEASGNGSGSTSDARDGDDAQGGESGEGSEETTTSSTRRRRRRTRSGQSERSTGTAKDEVTSVRGSTRLEAKRQRRREGREAGRRRTIITEAEFLARRESVDRVMVVRGLEDRTQIAVLEDGVPVEHYVSRSAQSTMVGNVYLGRVQNVLPSMEAAFVDIGKGRNAVLYAGEVNWDAAGVSGGEAKRIENALKSGESVLVQVTKDPIGHKGARLTSQISLPGRFLVYVPGNSMTGISRKLPENERARLKKILKEIVPADAGVIVRTAAEGASEAELRADVERLTAAWERISNAAKAKNASAPSLLHGEPDMTVRVIRDVFNEDFSKLIVSGQQAWDEVRTYIDEVAPDLADRVERHTGSNDVFHEHRVHEAIAKAMDRKVWLPSGGSLVIDRTEAMTVVDVNTGKFTGSGGNLEETVTKNNIEAAEEIVRQLRLRDIGGIIVIDFIDMVLESNRDLVVRRLLECLGRDRTKHQVAEVTSLGLVQMTRKRVGSGLIEVFSETCAHCAGRGVLVQSEPVGRTGSEDSSSGGGSGSGGSSSSRRGRGKGRSSATSGSTGGNGNGGSMEGKNVLPAPNPNGPTPAQIAAAAHAAALNAGGSAEVADGVARATLEGVDGREPDAEPRTDATGAETTAAEVTAAPGAAEAGAATEVGATPAGETATEPEAEPKRATTRSRGRSRRASQPPAAPAEVTPPVEVVPAEVAPAEVTHTEVTPEQTTAPEAVAEPATEQAPEPATTPEPQPRRRRRGRVVAPAGPPTGADGQTADAPAEADTE